MTLPRSNRPPPVRCDGAVLIVVMWASLGLVALTLVFGHGMGLALRASDHDLAGRQADQAIEGAVRYAMYLLENLETAGRLPLTDTYGHTQVPVGDAQFWFLDSSNADPGSTELRFGLMDEAARLNLNTATLEMLEALPGIPAEFAATIVDWRDEDDEILEGGAEAETYLLGSPSYACKNAPFETEEELLLLYQADPDLLFGDDRNRNGVLDPGESDGNGVLDYGLLAYVTVHSREVNLRDDGTPRVQVDRPPSEEVTELFTEAFGEDRAREIVAGLGGGGSPPLRSLVEVYIRGGLTEEEFEQVAANITVSDEPVQQGLVNVNTAGEVVLACLPGIDEETAAALVAHRLGRAEPPVSEAWIVEIIGEEAALEAGPYLTGRCSQARVDVAAVGRHGRGYRRRIQVIDHAETPQVVYRRDLGGLGWALGATLIEDLATRERNR